MNDLDLFPGVPDAFPLELLPVPLANVTAAVAQRYALDPAIAGAATLVAAAAAFGPHHLVDTWTPTPVSAALNFVVIGHSHGLLHGALDTVLGPVMRGVQERRVASHRRDPALLARDYQQNAAANAQWAGLGGQIPSNMRTTYGQSLALLRPEMAVESLTVARLKAALAESADGGLLLAPGRGDAGDHWLHLKTAERQELGAVLRRSWDGQACGLPELPAPVYLPMLWRVSPDLAPRFLDCPTLFGDPGVPFFILELKTGEAGAALAAPLEIGPHWEQLVKELLARRPCGYPVEEYRFSAEAAAPLIAYINRHERRRAHLADPRGTEFWPEAARRLSMIFAIMEDSPGLTATCVEAAIAVTEWYGRASLAAVAALRSVTATPGPVTRGLRERMLQRVAERGPVSWRSLSRSFSDSRSAVLAPIREQLIAEGRIGWQHGFSGPQLVLADGGATKSGHAAAGDSGDSGAAGLWAGPPPATEPDAGHQNLGTPASEPVAAAQPEPAARPGGAAPTGRPGTPVQPEPDFIFSHHHSPGARTACGLSPGPNPFGDDARHSPEANASAGTPD